MKNLKPGAKIHLMGICGTAMASLAGLLKDLGYQVTGSDQNVYPPMSTQLQDMGIEIMEGYKAENLNHNPDLVIVGNVISKHFPEAEALLNSEIPYTSLPAALGEFAIADGYSVVVAGTHGKTTTTSIMAWVAECCGLNPGFLIGGVPENFPRSFRAPSLNHKKHWFIIEGDEYDTAFFDKVPKFVHYKPRYVILTSIEFDHADIYENLDQILSAFQKLLELIPEDGLLVYNADDENIRKLLKYCRAPKVSFGLNSGDYLGVDRDTLVGRNQFTVVKNEQRIADLAIKMFGQHNTLNALGVFALAMELGWPEANVLQGLATFKGVKRRQEVIGEPRGITVVEDFAHHPTAVELTIQSIKERYAGRRVIAVFEPRSATSRRKVFQDQYVQALHFADIVLMPPAFGVEKLKDSEVFSSNKVVEQLNQLGTQAEFCKDVDDIIESLCRVSHPGDVILIMSNGGFGGIYGKLIPRLATC